jgi:hypothetical protein
VWLFRRLFLDPPVGAAIYDPVDDALVGALF